MRRCIAALNAEHDGQPAAWAVIRPRFDEGRPGRTRKTSSNGVIDEVMERLSVRYLNVQLTAVLHPASIAAQRSATEQKRAGRSSSSSSRERVGCPALKPDYANAFISRGVAWRVQGDFAADYDEAIRLNPCAASLVS